MTGVLHERPTARGALDAAREVAADVATRAERHDRDGSFAFENIDALWEAGLGNLTLPGAADLRTTAEAVRIVASGDPSTALVWVMHLIQLKLLTADGAGVAPHVREEVIASSLAGPALINALRVEPDLGTPARGGIPSTRRAARRRRLAADRAQDLLDRQRGTPVAARLGGDRGRGADRWVPGAGRRSRHRDPRDLGSPRHAGLGEPRRAAARHADPAATTRWVSLPPDRWTAVWATRSCSAG